LLKHSELERRIIFTGELVNNTQFRIGASEDDVMTGRDLPILKTRYFLGNSYVVIPYIPSTTLKGLIRSEYSRIINSLDEERVTENDWEEVVFGYVHKEKYEMDKSKSIKLPYNSFKGLIKLKDSFPVNVEEIKNNVVTRDKTSVRIDRKRRAAIKGMLYSMETVQPGASFDFLMILDNISTETLAFKILKFIIEELSRGRLPVGSRSSAGLGLFAIKNMRIYYYSEPTMILGFKEPLQLV